MNLKSIGNNIKELRLKTGLTQQQLAEKANISNVHMSHIETGNVTMSLDCLISLCNALETTPNSILMGEFKISPAVSAEVIGEYVKNLSSAENRFIIEMAKKLDELKINR